MKRILVASIFMMLGLGGCTNHIGSASITKKENLKQIRVYKSTKAQVRRVLGSPSGIMTLSRGREQWVYQHIGVSMNPLTANIIGNTISMVTGKPMSGQGQSKFARLNLIFNAKGVLISKKQGY